MKTLAKYKNGNCNVCLLEDGTKIVDFEDTPLPEYPISIDLKITDYCSGNCNYCHENSSEDGVDANLPEILDIIKELPKGTEIAIGGGDPFSFIGIECLLRKCSEFGLIANITVNAKHIEEHKESIQKFRNGLFYGLGVSYHPYYMHQIRQIADKNTVIHFIAGIHSVDDLLCTLSEGYKCLVLGYKVYGRGTALWNDVIPGLREWNLRISRILQSGHIAFDTLALQQLDVKTNVRSTVWKRHFMGEDGQLTMFVDAVSKTYGKSSTDTRRSIGNLTIKEMFQSLKENK